MCFRWFGRLLLEGSVGLNIPTTVLGKAALLEPASVMTQSQPHKKAAQLLHLLLQNRIRNRPSLLEALARERDAAKTTSASLSRYLLMEEIAALLLPEVRAAFRQSWMEMITSS